LNAIIVRVSNYLDSIMYGAWSGNIGLNGLLFHSQKKSTLILITQGPFVFEQLLSVSGAEAICWRPKI